MVVVVVVVILGLFGLVHMSQEFCDTRDLTLRTANLIIFLTTTAQKYGEKVTCPGQNSVPGMIRGVIA